MMFSTSAGADTTSGDSGAPAAAGAAKAGEGGGSEEGSKEGAGEGDAAAPPLEENPLEGVVVDDGDPGPPPPLDPSIVTEPSPKVNLSSLVHRVDLWCKHCLKYCYGHAYGPSEYAGNFQEILLLLWLCCSGDTKHVVVRISRLLNQGCCRAAFAPCLLAPFRIA